MFRKSTKLPAAPSKSAAKKAAPTVVSSDLHIFGNLVSEGSIDFDGHIDGNIRCSALVLRPNAVVNGEIHAENVQVFGLVKGLIKAKVVHLCAGSKMEGIVLHENLTIDEGASMEGKCRRLVKDPGGFHAPNEDEAVQDLEYEPTSAGKPVDMLRLIAG